MKTFCLVILLNLFSTHPKDLVFQQIPDNDKMLSNTINTIYQDSQGFMWIGSNIGLSKYDGYTVYNFKSSSTGSHTLSNYNVTDILEDTIPGNLWIATVDGLNYYDCSKDEFFEFSLDHIDNSGGISTNIKMLYWDGQNNLWLGTTNGVVCIDKQQKASVIFNPLVNGNSIPPYVSDIEHWKNDLYFISTTKGLYQFNKRDHSYTTVNVIKEGVLSIFKDSNGNFWFGTQNSGLWYLPADSDNDYQQFTSENSQLKSGFVSSIVEDSLGQIWISEKGSGISIINPTNDEWVFLESSLYNTKGIKSDVNNKIYIDRQKNVWIASFDAGIYFLDNNKKAFSTYRFDYSENDLKNNKVRSMYQDSEGDIWIGTKVDGYLNKFNRDEGTFEHYGYDAQDPQSLNDAYVLSITELRPGYILLGTLNGGLNLLNKKTGKFEHFVHDSNDPNTILNNAIYALLKDSKGRVWIGSGWVGLDVFSDSLHKLYSFNDDMANPNSLLGNRVRSIFEDREHNIWVGTEAGLSLYNEELKNFKRFYAFVNDSTSLSNSEVNCVYEDSKGRFWIATQGGGLNLMNREKGSFIHYTEKDGLASDIVVGIVEDDSGNLWLSTADGISKFTLPEDASETPKPNFRSYDMEDGLQGKEFNLNAFLRTTDGEILFGGNNGFNIFKPEAIADNPNRPYIHFTDLKLFNKSVEIGTPNSPLDKHINSTKQLTLNHKQSIFSISYVGINFSSSEKNQYAFILEGLEDNWNFVGTKREATYTNLNPGTYTFRVKASNNDGLWDDEGISLKIKILPPLWLTWWAYAFYAIISLVLILYLRHRAVKKNKIEKEYEINQLKVKFFTNISHEFRTPLTLILNPLDKLNAKSDPNEINKSLKSIKRNAHQLLGLVNQLLDHRKTELGMLAIHAEETDIIKFTKGVFNLYEGVTQSKNIQLQFHCDVDTLEMMVDRDKYEKILHNLLSNAIKFTNHGRISLHIARVINTPTKEFFAFTKKKQSVGYVEITVSDTGVGLSKKQIKNIFERFYQVDETKTGTGLGLNFVKSLVELQGGEILVESEENKGSSFIVRLPLQNSVGKKIPTIIHNANSSNDEVFNYKHAGALTPDIALDDHLSGELDDENIPENSTSKTQDLVLIVEDNRELRSQIKAGLSSSFRVKEAKNGEEGWQKTLKYYPDIIISDIIMPIMDGMELCKKVKTNIKTSHIPVILLTAKSLEQNKIDGFKTGADEYISKPFNMRLLIVRAANIIESRRKMKEKFSSSRVLVPAKEFTTNNLDEEFLDNLSKIVMKNIANPSFSPQTLADKQGTSSSNLYKKLNALTGSSPSKFIRDVRLKYAAELLLAGRYSVKEISYKAGFKSPSYFSKSFRELFDQTPVEYVESKSLDA